MVMMCRAQASLTWCAVCAQVVEDVVFERMTTNGTNQGLGVKIANSKANATGGLVRNISFRNMVIHAPRYVAG